MADRDLRIAAAWALNDTAQEANDHIGDRMTVVFDRPTKFTENAF
jgi:class 3 adenylate cyclase